MTKIICLQGPTGAGKTGLSLFLAQTLEKQGIKIAIINGDSRQVYADFPVITAQPTKEEQSICPHYLYGYLKTEEKINVGTWLQEAENLIHSLQNQGFVPLVVGGTGMYIKSLTEGIAQIPKIPQHIHKEILQRIERESLIHLYEELKNIDKVYAEKIHPNDKQRIGRALEVFYATEKNLTHWHNEGATNPKYHVLKLGMKMTLPELTPFLTQRINSMIKENAIEEAELALKNSPDTTLSGWSGIGCKELAQYLKKQLTFEEACLAWNKNTRAYAKRQLTWFNADSAIHWFHPFQENYKINASQLSIDFLK